MITVSKKEFEVFRKLIDYALWAEDNSLPCGIPEQELKDIKERL